MRYAKQTEVDYTKEIIKSLRMWINVATVFFASIVNILIDYREPKEVDITYIVVACVSAFVMAVLWVVIHRKIETLSKL